MKNIVIGGLILAFWCVSCSSVGDASQEPEQVSAEVQNTIKSGVVHRVFQRDHRGWTDLSVRLRDGVIISGYSRDGIEIEQTQQRDFFFAQPGDTIVYSGEKVLEVRFKD